MECKRELEDLKAIYQKDLMEQRESLEELFAPITHYMKQFLHVYNAIHEVQAKLGILNEKLRVEGEEDE